MRNGPLAGLRHRSPVHGLDRRNLRPLEVLAQSVSTAAPAAGMATVPAIVATTAGTATVWSFVLATAVALAVGACIATFTRRMAAAGSLYSLTAKGLGPGAAFACGAALLAGYAVLLMAALAGAALYTDALLTRLGWSASV
jgi:amino acid transporter